MNANTDNFDYCVIYNTAGDFYLRTLDVIAKLIVMCFIKMSFQVEECRSNYKLQVECLDLCSVK